MSRLKPEEADQWKAEEVNSRMKGQPAQGESKHVSGYEILDPFRLQPRPFGGQGGSSRPTQAKCDSQVWTWRTCLRPRTWRAGLRGDSVTRTGFAPCSQVQSSHKQENIYQEAVFFSQNTALVSHGRKKCFVTETTFSIYLNSTNTGTDIKNTM